MSDSLQSHGLQHSRLPCPSPSLGVAQAHVHWVSDAIQPSHSLSPSSSALNLSQHQGLFQWVSSSHQMAKVLELQLQHQSFQWIFRTNFLSDWLVWSPCSPRDAQVFSNTTVWKHQFFSAWLLTKEFICLNVPLKITQVNSRGSENTI